jgi:hypothetical protein
LQTHCRPLSRKSAFNHKYRSAPEKVVKEEGKTGAAPGRPSGIFDDRRVPVILSVARNLSYLKVKELRGRESRPPHDTSRVP